MQASVPQPSCMISADALARLMPMHLLLDKNGRVMSVGPTLGRALGSPSVIGTPFQDLFEVRAPGGAVTVDDLLGRAGHRFRLVLRNGSRVGLRGLGVRLDDAVLLNLSFGIDLITAVREFSLSDADFAATDLAMELLYLAEANSSVTRELRDLNLRLEGARLQAEEEAMTDPLTGLRNRRAVDLFLDRICATAPPFGLLQMDLDYFKTVNDTLGHAAGDYVLESVGKILHNYIRAEDCAARVGGDEFVIVFMNRTDPETLQAIADRIIAKVSQPMDFEGQPCRVSASIGIVRSIDMVAPDTVQLLAAADRALYTAKKAGRSRAFLLVDHGA